MIYHDPTETRIGSLLPAPLRELSRPLRNLEAMTGADMLLTRSDVELPADLDSKVGRLLWKTQGKGSMLVQRKTGADLIQSITYLDEVCGRMLAAQDSFTEDKPQVWLLVVGFFEPTMHAGRHYVKLGDGTCTDWLWSALAGALDYWQLRGGCIHHAPWDDLAVQWILQSHTRLPKLETKSVLRRHQSLVVVDNPAATLLCGLPDCGEKTALRLLDTLGSPDEAFRWILDGGEKVPGIGEKTLAKWREVLKGKQDDAS